MGLNYICPKRQIKLSPIHYPIQPPQPPPPLLTTQRIIGTGMQLICNGVCTGTSSHLHVTQVTHAHAYKAATPSLYFFSGGHVSAALRAAGMARLRLTHRWANVPAARNPRCVIHIVLRNNTYCICIGPQICNTRNTRHNTIQTGRYTFPEKRLRASERTELGYGPSCCLA